MATAQDRARASWHRMLRARRWARSQGPKETVEQYLARGGEVARCEPVYLVPLSTVTRSTRAR